MNYHGILIYNTMHTTELYTITVHISQTEKQTKSWGLPVSVMKADYRETDKQ